MPHYFKPMFLQVLIELTMPISYPMHYKTSINDSENRPQCIKKQASDKIAYFTDRKVSLCSDGTTSTSCANYYVPFYDATFSDIAAFFNYRFLENWQLMTNFTYNPNNSNIDSQTYQIQYMPDDNHIFNIGYRNIKNDYASLTPQQIQAGTLPDSLSQVTFSALWKLTPHWSLTGLWSYSFENKHTTNMFAGVQYDACSWAIRFLAQRYVGSSSDPNNPNNISGPLNNAFIVQFELKGLGGSSASSLDERLEMISGYNSQTNFG